MAATRTGAGATFGLDGLRGGGFPPQEEMKPTEKRSAANRAQSSRDMRGIILM